MDLSSSAPRTSSVVQAEPDAASTRSPRRSPLDALAANQEIFLRILSSLSAPQLAAVQGVNRYWQHMSRDPQLWKRLYLAKYSHPHHSKLIYKAAGDDKDARAGPSTPKNLRPIARLPSRAFPPPSPKRSPSVTPSRDKDDAAFSSSPAPPMSGRSAGPGHAVPLTRRQAQAVSIDEIGSGVRNDGVDWKMMLRLGTNWSRGNASSYSSITLPPSPSPSAASLDLPPIPPDDATVPRPHTSAQHIALSPSFIFTSDPSSPLVHVYASTRGSFSRLGIIPPPPGWSSPTRPDNISAIAADQSVPIGDTAEGDDPEGPQPARLAVFYQSGGIVVLSIRMDTTGSSNRMSWAREHVNTSNTRPVRRRRGAEYTPQEGDPIVLAVLHHPVLVTCSAAFHLSVYSLLRTATLRTAVSTADSSPLDRISTFHSDVSFHPAALSIFPTTTAPVSALVAFRASLTYSTPVYPASWTVAAQEFVVSLNPTTGTGDVARTECFTVGNTGSDGDSDEELVWPRRIKPVIGVKGRRATGIGTDGRWCVLSGADNQIQVYALPAPNAGLLSPPPSPSLGRGHARTKRNRDRRECLGDGAITHAQTLLAHSAEVTSLALTAGRCVSGGSDGRVLVWDLDEEADAGEAVAADGRVGRTVGYVEVRTGDERVWKGAAGPRPTVLATATTMTTANAAVADIAGQDGHTRFTSLPHPQAISSAARSFFLPRPPMPSSANSASATATQRKPAIRQLAFDEEKIVGLIRTASASSSRGGETGGDVMRVWNFNG